MGRPITRPNWLSRTPEQRFWAIVNKDGPKDCWIWTGACGEFGHGRFWLKGKYVSPHRFSFELANGPIPPGKLICHRCDNPRCVNPRHLYAGSASDNMQDMLQRDRKKGSIKLKVAQVKAIKRRLAKGECHRELAKEFRVSENSVYFVKLGVTWKNVEP